MGVRISVSVRVTEVPVPPGAGAWEEGRGRCGRRRGRGRRGAQEAVVVHLGGDPFIGDACDHLVVVIGGRGGVIAVGYHNNRPNVVDGTDLVELSGAIV